MLPWQNIYSSLVTLFNGMLILSKQRKTMRWFSSPCFLICWVAKSYVGPNLFIMSVLPMTVILSLGEVFGGVRFPQELCSLLGQKL